MLIFRNFENECCRVRRGCSDIAASWHFQLTVTCQLQSRNRVVYSGMNLKWWVIWLGQFNK